MEEEFYGAVVCLGFCLGFCWLAVVDWLGPCGGWVCRGAVKRLIVTGGPAGDLPLEKFGFGERGRRSRWEMYILTEKEEAAAGWP